MLKRSFTETADKFAFGAKKPKTENPSNEFRKAVPSDEYSKLKKRGKIGNFVSYPQKENNQHSGGEKVYEKLTRKQKKKLREKRRAFYDEATDIKKTWEFLRAETSKEKKEVLSQRIFDQLDSEEKLIQLCASHDTCRVLEWAFKFAKEETREKIFQIIKRNFVSLGESAMRSIFIKRLFNYYLINRLSLIIHAPGQYFVFTYESFTKPLNTGMSRNTFFAMTKNFNFNRYFKWYYVFVFFTAFWYIFQPSPK